MTDKRTEIRARHLLDAREVPPRFWNQEHNDRGTLLAEVDRLTRERDEAQAEVDRLREVIRTIRARCVELDDSDAVSATFDITNAVLEAEQ